MARIIETHLNPVLKVAIDTFYANGNIISDVFIEGDIIENLRYAENGDIKTVTGRLSKINYTNKVVKRNYTNIETSRSYFTTDVVATTVSLDCSEQYNSNIVNVPVKEILEFNPVDEVARMKISLQYGVGFVVELSDETSNIFELHEGSIYKELTYLDLDEGKDKTVEAKVVAISYEANLNPTSVIMVVDGSIKKLAIRLIKNAVGEIAPVVANTESVNTAIANSEGIVNLSSGEIVGTVKVEKDVVIMGPYPDVPVNSATFKGKTTDVIISGGIEVSKDVSVTLKGVTLTKDSYIDLRNGAGNLTLENCIIKDIIPYQAKSYLLLTGGKDTVSSKVVIKGCYFGNNTATTEFKYYNGFELNQKLADGSEISNNYFEEFVCTNNMICIYNVNDDATITITNNVFEYSGNAIRIGTKGDAKCHIIIKDNVYHKTDTNPEYAGLLLVQPYGVETTNMSNVVIDLIGNKHTDKLQLYYLYTGGNSIEFTDETKPIITVS